jgi:hypothetical protein
MESTESTHTIAHRRLKSQQLSGTKLRTPREVVAWMGAIQAQDFNMAKWAVGIRLPGITEQAVIEAFNKGDILRTHVLRPTWHFVAPENIRWMLALSAERIKSSARSRDRDLDITEELYDEINRLFRKMLKGKQLTREMIGKELEKAGITVNPPRMYHFLMRAELESIICSGIPAGKEQTYALLDDRVPFFPPVSKDEALARLVRIYFTSHCPATLADFAWWSGLSMGEVRQGMEAVKTEFVKEVIAGVSYYRTDNALSNADTRQSAYLLPAFDEYIISYRDRSAALTSENHSKVVSSNGVFRPTIVIDGKVAGLWKKTQSQNGSVALTFFEPSHKPSEQVIKQAVEAFNLF